MSLWQKLLDHLDNPAISHLKEFVTDSVSSFQNFEKQVEQRVADVQDEAKTLIATLEQRVAALEARIGGDASKASEAATDAAKALEDAAKT